MLCPFFGVPRWKSVTSSVGFDSIITWRFRSLLFEVPVVARFALGSIFRSLRTIAPYPLGSRGISKGMNVPIKCGHSFATFKNDVHLSFWELRLLNGWTDVGYYSTSRPEFADANPSSLDGRSLTNFTSTRLSNATDFSLLNSMSDIVAQKILP